MIFSTLVSLVAVLSFILFGVVLILLKFVSSVTFVVDIFVDIGMSLLFVTFVLFRVFAVIV